MGRHEAKIAGTVDTQEAGRIGDTADTIEEEGHSDALEGRHGVAEDVDMEGRERGRDGALAVDSGIRPVAEAGSCV